MFIKSKTFVIPVVALLAACMAVEAAPAADVPLPEACYCNVWSNVKGAILERSQDVCTTVGQANGAVWDAPNVHCDISTQSGYNSFVSDCAKYSNVDSAGEVHYGQVNCEANFPHVPVPQSCSCTDPSGANTTAQTLRACTLVGNAGTMVGDKCVVASDGQYYLFSTICPSVYPGSTATCSA
ncbi:hypothetical protein BGZ98_002227, partial [Dissophora globulifera]